MSQSGPGLRVRSGRGSAGAATVHLVGELDIATAPLLQDRLDALLADPALTRLVVDLSELAFADVVGLGTLLRGQRSLSARGGTLVLRGVGPLVQRVVDLLDLGGRLPLEGD